jgi:putative transposase
LIPHEHRLRAVDLIREAVSFGARKHRCCEVLEISLRTLQRWERGNIADRRKGSLKTVSRKLSEEEREQVVSTACSVEFRDCNPYEIVAIMAEKSLYLASESTFYRILREENMLAHRGNSRPAASNNRPPERVATGPNQVWCWDITYLRSNVSGMFYYAYVIIDIYSRKIVGWEISDVESSDVAINLFLRIRQSKNLSGVYLHSDNGNPMKGATMLVFLYFLGIVPSFSRPRVSDDNPFIESFFKTVKYTPGYPKCFTSESHAREWFSDFVNWYNTDHRHSQIGYVTPEQRHNGDAEKIYKIRNQTYAEAFEKHPERFSSKPRTWKGQDAVYLNPLPDTRKKMEQRAS